MEFGQSSALPAGSAGSGRLFGPGGEFVGRPTTQAEQAAADREASAAASALENKIAEIADGLSSAFSSGPYATLIAIGTPGYIAEERKGAHSPGSDPLFHSGRSGDAWLEADDSAGASAPSSATGFGRGHGESAGSYSASFGGSRGLFEGGADGRGASRDWLRSRASLSGAGSRGGAGGGTGGGTGPGHAHDADGFLGEGSSVQRPASVLARDADRAVASSRAAARWGSAGMSGPPPDSAGDWHPHGQGLAYGRDGGSSQNVRAVGAHMRRFQREMMDLKTGGFGGGKPRGILDPAVDQLLASLPPLQAPGVEPKLDKMSGLPPRLLGAKLTPLEEERQKARLSRPAADGPGATGAGAGAGVGAGGGAGAGQRSPCALCQFPFARVNLVTPVTRKAVFTLIGKWGADPAVTFGAAAAARLRLPPACYEVVRVCRFCTQFFDAAVEEAQRGQLTADADSTMA
ncbi:hypothetical protein FNF29_03285 [Cafeteria roenbergensis]|uniref:Uncharacterized protein n=1 Tax=Cafeteria roenbergensis TaxID=33653 RepID=A0A5A8CKQ9_CAFRO|nr:hypothetical protein FNF29_03285 [Cafeteria roenbergensis]|eukprot:KAA0153097.1 hypothetical protein FNF29_03285 [Cafeteria roenbergensis]